MESEDKSNGTGQASVMFINISDVDWVEDINDKRNFGQA